MSKATDDPRKRAERIVVQSLESLKQAGVMQLPKRKRRTQRNSALRERVASDDG